MMPTLNTKDCFFSDHDPIFYPASGMLSRRLGRELLKLSLRLVIRGLRYREWSREFFTEAL